MTRPAALRALAVGVAAFSLSWGLLHVGFLGHRQIRDTPLYQQYGDELADGHVPYRDFSLEYPPGALPMFVLPALGHTRPHNRAYEAVFESLMYICGIGALAAMVLVLRSLCATETRAVAALGLAGLAPLALGSVILSRYDLWPAALAIAALAALTAGRPRLGHGVLGLAVTVKLWPVVLAPLTVAHVWRTRGRRDALLSAAVLVAVVVLVFLPFIALSPGGVKFSLERQLSRPLQIESLASGVLMALHQLFGLHLQWYSSHGSQNLKGPLPNALGAASSAVQLLVLVGIWVAFARRSNRFRGSESRASGELVRHAAAATVAFVALGKVLSPQFLIWLIPLVPLVGGRRAVAAGMLLLAALGLTQGWFPSIYWRITRFDPLVSWLVFFRDVTLVALLVVLVTPLRARGRWRSNDRSPGRTRRARPPA